MDETKLLIATSENLRDDLKKIEKRARDMLKHVAPRSNSEIPSNVMLCVRHIEDARMRLGKVIQHSGDGVSKYDKGDSAR